MSKQDKKRVDVTLQVKELIYDIQNNTSLTGRAREAINDATYKNASDIRASDDDDDRYKLMRSVQTHFTALKAIVGQYIDETLSTVDNLIQKEIEEDGVLKLVFILPTNYNPASKHAIATGSHDYIVNNSLADWFSINAKEDSGEYRARAVQNLEIINKAIYKRVPPVRPTYD